MPEEYDLRILLKHPHETIDVHVLTLTHDRSLHCNGERNPLLGVLTGIDLVSDM